jgi:hypothetical protein
MPEPVLVLPPEEVFRIGRRTDPKRFSTITPDDAVLPRAGNRYDVPGGAVLYAATQARACFGETLARYRPSPKMRQVLEAAADVDLDDEGNFMVTGGITTDWRLIRTVLSLAIRDPLPFLDVEEPETHAFLSEELTQKFVAIGLNENLDLGDIHTRDRRISRTIAEWAYTAVDENGEFRFSGIRYLSRLSLDWECWAIFDGSHVEELARRSIELSDPDLQAVAAMWDLRTF